MFTRLTPFSLILFVCAPPQPFFLAITPSERQIWTALTATTMASNSPKKARFDEMTGEWTGSPAQLANGIVNDTIRLCFSKRKIVGGLEASMSIASDVAAATASVKSGDCETFTPPRRNDGVYIALLDAKKNDYLYVPFDFDLGTSAPRALVRRFEVWRVKIGLPCNARFLTKAAEALDREVEEMRPVWDGHELNVDKDTNRGAMFIRKVRKTCSVG